MKAQATTPATFAKLVDAWKLAMQVDQVRELADALRQLRRVNRITRIK